MFSPIQNLKVRGARALVLMGIKKRWNAACAQTVGHDVFWRVAVDHLSIERQLRSWIDCYACGRILDAGAGRLAWRSLLEPKASMYTPTDYFPSHRDLAFCADLQGLLPLADKSIDTIFCCSVMEHTPKPCAFARPACAETGRCVILSVPFLYYLHGEPADYFRFTPYGVVQLARAAGFKVIEQSVGGGFAHTVCHGLSMCITALLWHPRWPQFATASARGLFGIARFVDRFDRGHLFAQTVNVVLTHD